MTAPRRSYLSPKVRVRSSRIGGKGLFADAPLTAGEVVVDYTPGPGRLLTNPEATDLARQGYDYMLQVDAECWFAATSPDELEDADFLNHSCDPNCGFADRLRIITMREISPGEELTFDYAMNESDPAFTMTCHCGSTQCRGRVTGRDWLSREIQQRYRGYFSPCLEACLVSPHPLSTGPRRAG